MEPSILEEEAVSSVLATRRLAVLEAFLSAWNAHDVHRLMDCMAENCVFHSSAGPGAEGTSFFGRDAVRLSYVSLLETFPKANWTNGRHYVLGEIGLSTWRFIGVGKDGIILEVDGCDIFSFVGELIASKDSYRKMRSG